MRLERVREQGAAASERRERRLRQLELLEQQVAADAELDARDGGPERRIAAIEAELAALDAGRAERLARELAGLEEELAEARSRVQSLGEAAQGGRAALADAERAADAARAARREAERAAEAARAEAARVGAELAAVNQFVRGAASPGDARPLAESLHVEPGYELALAAVLGPRLTAGVVPDLAAGERLLDGAGRDGGSALVAEDTIPASEVPESCRHGEALLDRVRPRPGVTALATRLLGGVRVVDSLDTLPAGFDGIAVTRTGRLYDSRSGELSQAPAGGSERLLEELGRRDGLVAASERAAGDEAEAKAALERAAPAVGDADAGREQAESALRGALRALAEAEEAVSRAEWIIARRREAPDDGPEAVRRAELTGDLRAEQRLAERIAREREERARALASLRSGADRDLALVDDAGRAAAALERGHEALATSRDAVQADLDAGAAAGEETAAALKTCAREEAELQGRLKRASDALTAAEVAAQQVRDTAADAERELRELAARLGLAAEPAEAALPEDQREALLARVERLQRRREQLGPVNPLAKQEYEEAVAHVEELEAQRDDLETALAELEGLIKETDRLIRESFEETFAAAARNFEDVVEHLFPGGRGRLRLVHAEVGPRPVVGGDRRSPRPKTRTRSPRPASRSRSRRRASRRSGCRCCQEARSRSWPWRSCSPSSSPARARSTSSTRSRRRSTTSTSTASSSSSGATPTALSSSWSRTRSARWTPPTRSTA